MAKKILIVEGTAVPYAGDDVDTDAITPARFLRKVTFKGFGEYAFFDERYDREGNALPHPFNDPAYQGASIMLVDGKNFGCGSSREHAPQALYRWGMDDETGEGGLRVIVAESFAEIFFGNSVSLSMAPLTAAKKDIGRAASYVKENPSAIIKVDLAKKILVYGEDSMPVDMPEESRQSLMRGEWDLLEELLEDQEAIKATDANIPYLHMK